MAPQWEPRMPERVNEADALLRKTDTQEVRTDAWESRMPQGVNEAGVLPRKTDAREARTDA